LLTHEIEMTASLNRLGSGASAAGSLEAAIFRRKWQAAVAPGRPLPPYEELVLGSLGKLADHLIVLEGEAPGHFKVLRAGRSIVEWIGHAIDRTPLDALPRDCAAPLREILMRALQAGQPVATEARRVRDGMVETFELLALPMSCRWGSTLIAAYVREHGIRYNLVDTIFRSTDEGILALAALRDIDGRATDFQIVALNAGAARLLRLPEAELRWRRLSEVNSGLSAPAAFARLLATLQTGRHDRFELTVSSAAEDLHLNVGVAAVGDLVSATLTDIGEVKRREASFRLLFDGNPVPMWLYDPDNLRFVGVNAAAVAHYGYERARFLNMSLPDLWPADEWDIHRETARTVADAYQSDRTWRHLKADGSEIEVLTYARRVPFGAREAVLVAIVDVTARKQAEARIAYMAHHDALTGLPNRVLFHERLDAALARVRRAGAAPGLAVHCLDLDHFKSVNDTLGHPVGDLLLKAVAERLGRCVGEEALVARLGGDEFAVIQPIATGPNAAGELASRLIAVVAAPYDVQGHEVVIGASIGIALAPEDGDTADALLRNADMALYRAKGEGRGTSHFFEPEMDRRIQARRSLELDLRKAFVNGEFELYYQPLVNLGSNAVAAFEALLRWHHPERGLISPMDFIPLAEEIGLIVPLGEWVLRQACAQAATWPGGIKVAVNLSPAQFRSRGVVQAVLSALAHSRLAPQRLELEITESVLLGETDANLATLHRLREIGARISMDDFGTGYCSLSYLRSFPFDKIKIDRSFVRELVERPDCVAIVRAVAGLGASLGIATTAEGVETREQLDRLRREGCTEVQGFLLSPPRPADEIVRLMPELGVRMTTAA
jgi:diguanylate cyclase (GGDEF)-like protein/PAS domain S-box-containing protein